MPHIKRISGKHTVLALLILFSIFFLLKYGKEVLIILKVMMYACTFSLVLSPLCGSLEKKGVSSSIASAIAILLTFLTVCAVIGILLPYMITHFIQLIKRCLPVAEKLLLHMLEFVQRLGFSFKDVPDIGNSVAIVLSKSGSWLARSGASMVSGGSQIAFAFIISYYLLREKVRFGCHMLLLVPSAHRENVLFALRACRNAIMGYLSGMLKTSLFVGGATFLSLGILGVDDALLLGILMGILEFVPYIGPVIGTIPIVLSAVPMGQTKCMIILMIVLIIQQVEGNFIGPYFTAANTSLHPLTALLCVFIFGSLFGVKGILLAIPLFIASRSILTAFLQSRNLVNP